MQFTHDSEIGIRMFQCPVPFEVNMFNCRGRGNCVEATARQLILMEVSLNSRQIEMAPQVGSEIVNGYAVACLGKGKGQQRITPADIDDAQLLSCDIAVGKIILHIAAGASSKEPKEAALNFAQPDFET
jgi:hypothetical protein